MKMLPGKRLVFCALLGVGVGVVLWTLGHCLYRVFGPPFGFFSSEGLWSAVGLALLGVALTTLTNRRGNKAIQKLDEHDRAQLREVASQRSMDPRSADHRNGTRSSMIGAVFFLMALLLALVCVSYPWVLRYLKGRVFRELSGMALPQSGEILYEKEERTFAGLNYAIQFRVSKEDMESMLRDPPPWAEDGWRKTTEPGFFRPQEGVTELNCPDDEYYAARRWSDVYRKMVINVSKRMVYLEVIHF